MEKIMSLLISATLSMMCFLKGAQAQSNRNPSKTAQSRSTVSNEKNPEYQRAMVLKRQEKFTDAAEIFAKITQDDPKNADALQQLATLYGWLGRYDESVSVWKKAIDLYPNNPEYRDGLAQVLRWKAGMPLLWRIDAGTLYDGYHDSPFRVAEQNSYAQITRAFTSKTKKSSLWIRHEWQYHFQLVDNTIYAGGSLWPFKALAVQAEAGFTATPNFQPTQQYKMTLDFPISKYFIPSIGLKYLSYRDGNVNLYSPALRVQPFSWIGVSYQHLFSKNISPPQDTEGWQMRADLQAGESISCYIGYAQGKESLPSAPGGLLRTSYNETTFLGLILQLSKRWSWRIDYSYEERPNFYIRSSLGSGLTFKF